MSDEEDQGRVIELFPPIQAPLVLTRGNRLRACKHRRITVDVEARQIECSACGADVDAVEWLVAHTQAWRTANENWRATKDATLRLRREHQDLKRKVRNLKAQEKRWKARVASVKRECSLEERLAISIETAKKGRGA